MQWELCRIGDYANQQGSEGLTRTKRTTGGIKYDRLTYVTTADVITHWRKGAKKSLRLATASADERAYEFALFHCHLAVEKALKAAIMEKTRKPHPKVHDLLRLASLLHEDWTATDQELFDTLSDFAIAARYDDPAWAERVATAKNARRWISRTTTFLTHHKLL